MNGVICMAECLNSYVTGTKAELYKCWIDVGLKEKEVGKIVNGKIHHTNNSLEAKYRSIS